ncbi:MAG: ankyrin repeat domain-containing protein [Spirochaetaceae bacterium]|jgi:ankyrin repeat protein|nr:ankyrin repeat domain-containing protein [Spirochaetaceae bacterium]
MRLGSLFLLITVSLLVFSGCYSQPVWKDLSLDNREKAQEFLQGMLNVNSPDEDRQGQGRAPIHMAVDLLDDSLVKFIIDLGADINRKDADGRTPLRITWENVNQFNALEAEQRLILKDETLSKFSQRKALKNLEKIQQDREANIRIVKLLVDAGADIHENNSALARSALLRGGNYFSALLNPRTVSSTNAAGRTILHIAAEEERYQTIKSIAETDERKSVNKRDNEGKTALDLALNRPESVNAMKTAEQLILVGADSENPLFSYLTPAVQNSNYNTLSLDGNGVLHFAAAGNYEGLVQYLLEKRANVDIRNASGATPFHEAVKRGNLNIMRQLIAGRADINAQDAIGNTAMHLTVSENWHREVLNFLLDNQANPNIKNEHGDTPLHMMITLHRDADIILRLLSGGADVSIRNIDGKTPLYLAVEENRVTHIAPLLSYNSDIFAVDNEGVTPFDRAMLDHSPTLQALITPGTVFLYDRNGDTILHKAVRNHGDAGVVNLILEKGAWINARNKVGDTSLHLAIRQNVKESGTTFLSSPHMPDLFVTNVLGETPLYLIFNASGGFREWALTPAVINIRDGLGNTILHYAAQWRQDAHIPAIIKKGAAINAQNNAGESPIFEAIKINALSTVQTLILAGASISVRDNLGNTPLHTAIRWNALAGAEALIKAGADINTPNAINRKTPLHDAVRLGMSGFEKLLIENGADLEIRDSEGNTPIMEAFRAGLTGMVSYLADAGADPLVRDIRGNTPLHIAIAMERFDLVTLILGRGADIHAKNIEGKSSFEIALTKTNSPHIVWALLTTYWIQSTDDLGQSPLHIAVQQGVPLSMLGLIMERGGKAASLDAQGRTPLRLAVDMAAWDTARFLVDNGSDVFAFARDGQSPALIALAKGKPAMNALFGGAAIRTWDSNGDTILHHAVRYEGAGEETIRFLLELGADRNIRNQNGKSPLQIAREMRRSAGIIRVLDQ